MRIVAIVQARTGSSRLPGKVLERIQGRSLLEHECARLALCSSISHRLVATTLAPQDDAIVDLCKENGIACFRGSESDVLARFAEAARWAEADIVVRLTADCPLIDFQVVDRVVEKFRVGGYDYVSNCLTRTYPRGLDTEVFSIEALESAHQEAALDWEREHVTPFIYHRPQRFVLGNEAYPTDLSGHRWTVDTPADLELVRRIYDSLYPTKPDFLLDDVLRVLQANPDWVLLNREVVQKERPQAN